MEKDIIFEQIKKLKRMIGDSDGMSDSEKNSRIDGLDDLHETLAYAR